MESTTGSTAGGSVPTPGPVPDRLQPRTIAGVIALGFVGIFLYAAFNVQLPYYAFAPGSALDTSRLVVVDADHAFPPEGKILMTTVSLGKVTLFEAIEGWLDPGVDVLEERFVTPPEIDEDEFREMNLAAMADSKEKAIGVAFEALGVDAITGSGAEVVQIEPGTPADGALEVGDVIIGVDADVVALDADAIRSIGGHTPGDTVTFRVDPSAGGEPRTVEVRLAARPDDPSRAYLGVSLTTKDLAFDFPFEVDLESEQIGGPSAGLAFTLAVIDRLTEGELTGGETVAATGTIELDGSVGEVGGVAQKTIAVRRSGATLFLVPPGELELATKFAGDDLRVVAVANLDDALAALADVGGNALALPNLGSEGAS
jgi:PDZ domain-containing protein